MVINFFTVQRNGAIGLLTDTKQSFHNISTFCTDQTGNTQNFAFVQIERDIANRRLTQRREVAHLKNDFAWRVLFIREALVQRAPNHHGDDFVHVQPFKRLSSDPLPVTQNSDFIAQLEDLFHFVRDINNAAAALFQFTDNSEKVIHLFFR
ncbi:hypothetical protein D3C78_1316650 [compost metagenome]